MIRFIVEQTLIFDWINRTLSSTDQLFIDYTGEGTQYVLAQF